MSLPVGTKVVVTYGQDVPDSQRLSGSEGVVIEGPFKTMSVVTFGTYTTIVYDTYLKEIAE